ncbi:PilZ domain-containing protein [Dyella ginsengisoli]|uniref:PilZ domain-containing protein n=1 Tax=Dyella ginsengisoli TaxID=363848 RepID=UPI0003496B58|nr:PilZ domain-containing protein [Dyella ginsengisoli]
MSQALWPEFSERVSVADELRVAVTARDVDADAASLARLAERNVAAMASIAALEERRPEPEDDGPVMQELARLDAKLNALVELVGRALQPVGSLPPRRAVRFNSLGIVVPSDLLPAGHDLCVRLHPDVCPSLLLELPASLERSFDDGRAFLAFLPLGEAHADALERLVFRTHRRKIAETRQSLT